MRASFLAQERCDLSETVKRLAQGMAKPRVAHMELLKRLARYLIAQPDLSLIYWQQRAPAHVTVCVDSDFAGDKICRKSTTGMAMYLGRHLIKATSNLQSVLGLNVSESEYYALVHGACHGLGVQANFLDLGVHLGLIVAKAFASRQGLGKQRHVQTRFLWLQQAVAASRVVIRKISTTKNTSDILTKAVDRPLLEQHLKAMSLLRVGESHLQKTIH